MAKELTNFNVADWIQSVKRVSCDKRVASEGDFTEIACWMQNELVELAEESIALRNGTTKSMLKLKQEIWDLIGCLKFVEEGGMPAFATFILDCGMPLRPVLNDVIKAHFDNYERFASVMLVHSPVWTATQILRGRPATPNLSRLLGIVVVLCQLESDGTYRLSEAPRCL